MPTAGWLTQSDLPVDAAGRRYIDPASLDQILDQDHNWRGDVNAGGHKLLNAGIEIGNAEIGAGQTGNREAYVDLIGDDTYSDYGLRLIRNSAGPNAMSELLHRGTGELRFTTQESAPVSFYVGATEALRITASGIRFPDGTTQGSAGVPSTRQIIAGTGLTGGGNLSVDRTLSVVDDTSIQKSRYSLSGALVGSRRELNFVPGPNVALTLTDDAANNRVNITIDSTGGGSGGSQTPWLTDINANQKNLLNALSVRISGAAGTDRALWLTTNGVARWLVSANSQAETGTSPTGSDFAIYRCADDGSLLSTALLIKRDSGGYATFGGALQAGRGIVSAGSMQGVVANSACLDFFSGTARILCSGPDTSTYGGFQIVQASSNQSLVRYAMVIDAATGNMGIGTSSTPARLTTVANTDVPVFRAYNAVNSGGSVNVAEIVDDRGYSGNNSGATLYVKSWNATGSTGKLFSFNTFNGSDVPVLVGTLGGNVGIGTAAPSTRLNVAGGRTYLMSTNDPWALGLHYSPSDPVCLLGAAQTGDLIVSNGAGVERARVVMSTGDIDIKGQYKVNGVAISGGSGITTQSVVTGSRALATQYQNATGKPMFVNVIVNLNASTYVVAGTGSVSGATNTNAGWATNDSASGSNLETLSFWVMPLHYYKLTLTGSGGTIQTWIEWY